MKTTKDKMEERKIKKDAAIENQDNAQNEKEQSASDLSTAESTLKNGEEEHKEWKITLAKDRKAELEAREKELKLVPYRIRKEQQQKYSATHGAEQKEFMERKRKSDTVEAAWNKEEQAVKAATAQQNMLEGEKKSLFKNLGDAVRTEYRTGKKLKKARDHLDTMKKNFAMKEATLAAKTKKELGIKQKEKEDADLAKELKEKEEEEEANADKVIAGLDQVEQNLQQDEEEHEMAAETDDNQNAQNNDNNIANSDKDKLETVDKEKSARSKELKKKADEAKVAAELKEKEEMRVKNSKKESMGKIVTIKQQLKNDKSAIATKESTMKSEEKTVTERVKTLRTKEAGTKHALLDEQHKNRDVTAKEAELRAQKEKLSEVKMKSEDKLARASKKLKIVDEIVKKHEDKESSHKAKEQGVKADIETVNQKAQAARDEDKKAQEETVKANQLKDDADKRRELSMAKRNKAIDDEKKSKNDAMERTKKHESAGIQRAMEKKSKTGEVAVKAMEHRAELREKQYNRAKKAHRDIVRAMDKAMEAKDEVGKEHSLVDLFSVKAMEEKNEEEVNSSEKTKKSAVKDSSLAEEEATEVEQQVSEKKIKKDEAISRNKKAVDVLEAFKRGHESAEKAHTVANQESTQKSTKTAMHDAEADQRDADFKEKDTKSEMKQASAEADKLVTKEATTKKDSIDAHNQKNQAEQDLTVAERQAESGTKVAERYRTLTAAVEEREQKRKTTLAIVQQNEKQFKLAQDEATTEAQKCKKLKAANANIGKAFSDLKKQMAEWSNKNPWLKQDEDGEVDNADGTGPLGETRDENGLDEVSAEAAETYIPSEEYDDDSAELPPFARKSFMQLLQEDYGTDVRSFLARR
jgi:hypothetical protein